MAEIVSELLLNISLDWGFENAQHWNCPLHFWVKCLLVPLKVHLPLCYINITLSGDHYIKPISGNWHLVINDHGCVWITSFDDVSFYLLCISCVIIKYFRFNFASICVLMKTINHFQHKLKYSIFLRKQTWQTGGGKRGFSPSQHSNIWILFIFCIFRCF